MGQCYITRRGISTGRDTVQLGIYPTGEDGRPTGNVTVPDNVTNLHKYVFYEDKNVTSVTLPDNLQSIDNDCFRKCTNLSKVILSKNLKTVGTYAFSECSNLLEIDIPNSMTIIPERCFDECSRLNKVSLPNTLTTIESQAFRECTNLTNLEVPDDLGDLIIEGGAFNGCSGLSNEIITKLAIKAKGSIYNYAFTNLDGITEIITAYVGNYYFSGCANLEKLTILNPLNDGSFGVFICENCPKIKEVILPNEATQISNKMFYENKSLTIVNIPTSIQTIGEYAFYRTSINNITLPNGLTRISASAFSGCSSLSNITISENVSYKLDSYCFSGTGITNEAAYNIMEHCSSSYLSYGIFSGCNNLTDVEVKWFESNMFSRCENLVKAKSLQAHLEGSDSDNREVFYECPKLQEVYLAEGTTTIGMQMFYNCPSLRKVYLPSSINRAVNSSLTSTSSSYYAFYKCTALEDIQVGTDWNMSLRLDVSENITHDSMVAMFNNLKDLTGETAKTLTLGATNLAKLTDEEKTVATNKNWTLA